LINGGTFSGTLSAGALQIYEVVSSGVTISSETITSGIDQTVLSGGITQSVGIAANGEQDVYGTTSNTTVSSGGIEIVASGGTASGTTVLSGGEILVYSGANIVGLTVSSGGSEVIVSSGGGFFAFRAPETLQASLHAGAGSSNDPTSPTILRVTADTPAVANSSVRPELHEGSSATGMATVEATVGNLIQAMASFNAGTASQAVLFESVSGGLLTEDPGAVTAPYRPTLHHSA
jgi:autotransporter passenger strand-loop-strand repeat protein